MVLGTRICCYLNMGRHESYITIQISGLLSDQELEERNIQDDAEERRKPRGLYGRVPL